MLTSTPMKNLAGVRLEGDYLSLRALHDTIHEMVHEDRTAMSHEDGDTLIGLAYDVRKAYERQRDVIQPPAHYEEMGVRYGVKIIWPTLLVQSRQMRSALAYGVSTSTHQACIYDLEAMIEVAIKDQFGQRADEIERLWRRIDPRSPDVVGRLDPLGGMFCAWSRKERAAHMPALLMAFDAMHSNLTHEIMLRQGRGSIPPAEIEAWRGREWVDPEKGR